MKNLKTFVAFLKDEKLREFTEENLEMMAKMRIPILKQFSNLGAEEMTKRSMISNTIYLTALIDGTAVDKANESLWQWEENKLAGISNDEIQPSDLVLMYSAQKKVMLNNLLHYTHDAAEVVCIVGELEDYFTLVQESAVTLFFKLQNEIERNLREREESYKDLLENTSDLVHAIDPDEKILYVNKNWLDTLGYSKEEVLQTKLKQYVHPDLLQAYDEAIEKARNGITTELIETVFIAKNGEELTLEGNISWKFADGTSPYSRGIFRNITRRKTMELELANTTNELLRSNKELEQFAYVASHDLQEPLRMIHSYIQLLASRYKDKIDADANDFINFAIDGSIRMRTLINSLLEYSRVNRSKPFELADSGEILAEVLSDMENSILENGARIHYSHMPTVFCDRVLLGQVFLNLIGNALKYKSNKKSPEIYISGKKQEGVYLFAVKDNGIGIEKEYFEKIFVIFQRLNSMDKYQGTGIGLAICKKIVEKHGGQIWVESEPEKGATFYFTIK
jgi:PAS domain S-box-containing protein